MQPTLRRVITLALLIGIVAALTPTFTVRAATYSVTNTADSGNGSFRKAIEDANANPGPDAINFNIAGSGTHTITLSTPLPVITGPVTISAEGEAGWVAATSGAPAEIRVEISGASISGTSTGLIFGAGSTGSSVRGLAINRFTTGIELQSGGNSIQGNIIGLGLDGLTTPGGMQTGIRITNSSGNTIGGTLFSARNVIGGASQYGVVISGAASSSNSLLGNYIGLAEDGSTTASNGTANNTTHAGVYISGAPSNTIGGTSSAARNIISGNRGNGILIDGANGTGNVISGNYIGINAAGTAARANDRGIYINSAPDNVVGGTSSANRNIISGNTGDGVTVIGEGASGNRIQGNYIGTNVSASGAIANGGIGLYISNAPNPTVGGGTVGARNIIAGNTGDGILLEGNGITDISIVGNYVGVNSSGGAAIPNGGDGLELRDLFSNPTAPTVTIGTGNVFSGNAGSGINLVNSSGLVIAGNFVGTNATGVSAVGNATGIFVSESADNLIGGTTDSARNIISGNAGRGIVVSGANSTNNIIRGNYIGTGSGGTSAVANTGVGVDIVNAPATIIGGTTTSARNIISGNGSHGIHIRIQGGAGGSVGSNLVQGNYIGVGIDGNSAVPNVGNGIVVAQPTTTIGGSVAARNVISGNGQNGILLDDIGATVSNNIIRTNYIGIGANGTTAVGNSANGILINNVNNTIGGVGANEGNVIANNNGDGVTFPDAATNKNGSSIRGNSMFNNGGLGIDLPPNGVTANDEDDVDSGANTLQNFPVLTAATQTPTNYLISGTLNSTPGTQNFLIDFYASATCSSNIAQGRTYLGSTAITTNAQGDVTFTEIPVTAVPDLRWVVATATNPTGNTSEFSACVRVNNRPTISAINDIVVAVNESATIDITVGDFETPPADLLLSFESSNPAVVAVADITEGGSGANRTVNVTPVTDANGVTDITVRVTDADGASVTEVFKFTVSTPPTISNVPNQSTSSGVAVGPINFTVGDAETPVDALTVTGSSSNTTIIPNANIVIAGTGANRTVTVTPAAGQSGTVTVTLTVSDGFQTATDTFDVVVGAAPVIVTNIPDLTVNAGAAVPTVQFTISDADTALNILTVSETSSNQNLVTNAGLNSVCNVAGVCTLTITPVPGVTGTTTITVTVADNTNGTDTEDFVFRVNALPTISAIADQSTPGGVAVGPIQFTINDLETPASDLNVSRTSSNTTLVPLGNIQFGGLGGSRTVTVTPVTGVAGFSDITITVTDLDGGTASETFRVSVSQPPTISDIPNQLINVNATLGPINFTVTDDNLNTLSFSGTSSNQALVTNGNITFGGSGGTRTLTVFPQPNARGVTTITVTVTDNSGLTASDTFQLTVNAPPTISSIPNQSTPVSTPLNGIQFTVGDEETAANNLLVSATSSNQALVTNGNITTGGSGSNRFLSITPLAGQQGVTTITVSVRDADQSVTTTTFELNVFPGTSTQLLTNGNFNQPIGNGNGTWGLFSLPGNGIVSRIQNGVFEFYRAVGSQQAVILQNTNQSIPLGQGVVARLDLGNSSNARKRVLVLLHNANFNDTAVCTFWLEPNTPLRTYRMRGATSLVWTNASMSVYISTADGQGYVRMDNVELWRVSGLSVNETLCIEPTPPTPPGGADGTNLVDNGSFNPPSGYTTIQPDNAAVIAPWKVFGTPTISAMRFRLTLGGVFEFYRSTTGTSAVVFQNTGDAIPANSIVQVNALIGNSSNVRKRAVVLVHDSNFSDLQVCSFWIPPNAGLSSYVMRFYNARAWTNASISIYASTSDALQWLQLDNVTMRTRPSQPLQGTECYLPGAGVSAAEVQEVPASLIPTLEPTATPAAPQGELPLLATPAPVEIAPAEGAQSEGLLSEDAPTENGEAGSE